MGKRKFDSSIVGDLKSAASSSFGDYIKMIDVDDLLPNEANFYSMSDIESLADDIERQGLKHNLVVQPSDTDGKYMIISGHRRCEATQLLILENRIKSPLVPCYVSAKKSADDTMLDLIMLNATGRELSDAERLKQYETLKAIFENKKDKGEKFGRIRDKIADVLKVSPAQVGKYEAIDKKAISEVKEAVESGELSISTASEIAKLDEDEQKEILENTPISEIKTLDVKNKKKTKNKSKPSKKSDENVSPVAQNDGDFESNIQPTDFTRFSDDTYGSGNNTPLDLSKKHEANPHEVSEYNLTDELASLLTDIRNSTNFANEITNPELWERIPRLEEWLSGWVEGRKSGYR